MRKSFPLLMALTLPLEPHRALAAPTDPWVQLGTNIVGGVSGDFLGRSVKLSADGLIVAAGAHHHDNGRGHVRVHAYNPYTKDWMQTGEIDGAAQGDYSGKALAMSADGRVVAIASPDSDMYGTNTGHVTVYSMHSEGNWTQLGQVLKGINPGDLFGSALAINDAGTVLAIGGPFYGQGSDSTRGMVRVVRQRPNRRVCRRRGGGGRGDGGLKWGVGGG